MNNRIKKYKFTVDIAEYNSYRLTVFAKNISKSNDILMKFNKSVKNKNIKLSLLEVGSGICYRKSPSNVDVNLLSVERYSEGNYTKIKIESIYQIEDGIEDLKFNYIIRIAEYNRYSILINSQYDISHLSALIKSNKKQTSDGYMCELTQVASKLKQQSSEPVIIVDVIEQ
jgi:hypothetical protein